MDPGCMRMAFSRLYISRRLASLILCEVAQQQHAEQPEQPHSQLLHPRPTLTISRQLVTSNLQRMNPPRPRRAPDGLRGRGSHDFMSIYFYSIQFYSGFFNVPIPYTATSRHFIHLKKKKERQRELCWCLCCVWSQELIYYMWGIYENTTQ